MPDYNDGSTLHQLWLLYKLLASLHSGDPLFRILHISSHQSFVQYRDLLVKMVKVNSYSESPPPVAVGPRKLMHIRRFSRCQHGFSGLRRAPKSVGRSILKRRGDRYEQAAAGNVIDVGGSHAMNDTLRTLSLWDVWTAAHRAGVDFNGVRNFVHHRMS